MNEKNRDAIHDILYGPYLRAKKRRHKYAIRDEVRLAKYRRTFQTNNATNFTEELFSIADTLDTNPPTYRVRDPIDNEIITGAFYEHQLQPFTPKK